MASRLVWIPVCPSVTPSDALNFRGSGGSSSGLCVKVVEGSQAAPAAQAARWRNSRRFIGPPYPPGSELPYLPWTRKRSARYHPRKDRPRPQNLTNGGPCPSSSTELHRVISSRLSEVPNEMPASHAQRANYQRQPA